MIGTDATVPEPSRPSRWGRCPACGAADALILFRSIECSSKGCALYTESAADEARRRWFAARAAEWELAQGR